MLSRIPVGVTGLDEIFLEEGGLLPENTVTLVYGPPKVGKSLLAYHFIYEGLENDEPCLYIGTDQSLSDLKRDMTLFGWEIDEHVKNGSFYMVDTVSTSPEAELKSNYFLSSIDHPTDMMVKLDEALHGIVLKSPRFRSVLDSLTTLMALNDELLVIRVLTAYIMRIKERGGTAIVTYTEGASNPKLEAILKAIVDNMIYLDGENLTIEAMIGSGKITAPYKITGNGMVV